MSLLDIFKKNSENPKAATPNIRDPLNNNSSNVAAASKIPSVTNVSSSNTISTANNNNINTNTNPSNPNNNPSNPNNNLTNTGANSGSTTQASTNNISVNNLSNNNVLSNTIPASKLDRQDSTSPFTNNVSNNDLSPPKSLPDLAKDMYSGDQSNTISSTMPENKIVEEKKQPVKLTEPPKVNNVPKFDLNLLKKMSLQKPSSESIEESRATSFTESTPLESYSRTSSSAQNLKYDQQKSAEHPAHAYQGFIARESLSNSSNLSNLSYGSSMNPIAGGSFFDNFEKFLLGKPQAVSEIFSKLSPIDLVERMKAFHSNAPNDTFSELSDLERLWVLAEQRRKAVSEISLFIESEIMLKSTVILKQGIIYDTRGHNADAMQYQTRSSSVPEKITPFSALLKQKTPNEQNNSTTDTISANNISGTIKDGIDHIQNTDSSSSFETHYSLTTEAEELSHLKSFMIQDPSKFFYFIDGNVATSLNDFVSVLGRISDNSFYYHVNNSRNDFANWIEQVFDSHAIANKMRSLRTKSELLAYVKILNSSFGF